MAQLNHLPRAARLIRRTQSRLRDLAIWRAAAPVIVLISLYLVLALLGLFEVMPMPLAAFATLITFVGLGIGTIRGLNRYKRPDKTEAIDSLDAQSELRPLSTLTDRMISKGGPAQTLWKAHEGRLINEIGRLKVPRFVAEWRRVDPLYLRALLPLSLLAAIALSWGTIHPRLATALTPDYGSLFGAQKIRVEAWITPPDYTGRAPIFLKPDQAIPQVPAGSQLTLRAQAPTAPRLIVRTQAAQTDQVFAATPDGAYETTARIEGTGSVHVNWWGERYSWTFSALPDAPPTVEFIDLPEHTPTDRTAFSWATEDDYGVSQLELAIRPIEYVGETDRVRLELGGALRPRIEDESALDLTRNRWAGTHVEVQLIATDGAGQTGRSAPFIFRLPDRLMIIPLAKAIQDVRVTLLREEAAYQETQTVEDGLSEDGLFLSATQRLNQAPPGVQRAALMLEALTFEAPQYFRDVLLFSGLETARFTLSSASATAEAKTAEPLLWAMALRAEYGSAADAYAALMAAKEALENALRDGADEAEIKRLMEAFRQAAQRYVAARMAEALANGLESAPDDRDGAEGPDGPALGGDSFSDMLDALEDLSETGATEQARQLLADITNLLENLQFQEGNGSGDGFPGLPGDQNAEQEEDDRPEEEREISETMQELLDLLREQRELNDETLAQQRGERGTQQLGETGETAPNNSDENGSNGIGEEESLAERQRGLADRLDDLMEQTEDGAGLGELLDQDTLEAIQRAQNRAGSALENQDETRAIRNQELATEQFLNLAEQLAEELDALEQARRGDVTQAADPLGRAPQSGLDDQNSVQIPDQQERERARDILEELRRRYENTEDDAEREYLDRLLDRF